MNTGMRARNLVLFFLALVLAIPSIVFAVKLRCYTVHDDFTVKTARRMRSRESVAEELRAMVLREAIAKFGPRWVDQARKVIANQKISGISGSREWVLRRQYLSYLINHRVFLKARIDRLDFESDVLLMDLHKAQKDLEIEKAGQALAEEMGTREFRENTRWRVRALEQKLEQLRESFWANREERQQLDAEFSGLQEHLHSLQASLSAG